MVRRRTISLRKGDVLEMMEYYCGTPALKRADRRKRTTEEMDACNMKQKARVCQRKLIQYFEKGDIFATLTYRPENRPENIDQAKKDWARLRRKLAAAFKKTDVPFRWIRNIERGTRGAWHIHLVIKRVPGIMDLLQQNWPHGGIYSEILNENGKFYDEKFKRLADYITKSEKTVEKKADGTKSKPRLKESDYHTSQNMPLPEGKDDDLKYWRKERPAKKGYVIMGEVEEFQPDDSIFKFRRVFMKRIRKEDVP